MVVPNFVNIPQGSNARAGQAREKPGLDQHLRGVRAERPIPGARLWALAHVCKAWGTKMRVEERTGALSLLWRLSMGRRINGAWCHRQKITGLDVSSANEDAKEGKDLLLRSDQVFLCGKHADQSEVMNYPSAEIMSGWSGIPASRYCELDQPRTAATRQARWCQLGHRNEDGNRRSKREGLHTKAETPVWAW